MEGEEVTSDISSQKASFNSHNDDQSLYFVPYKWWKEAKDYCSACDSNKKEGVLYIAVQTSYGGPLKILNMFYSDLMFNLNRDDECMQSDEIGDVGVLSRDYALVHGDVWLEALKWHSSKNATKNGKSFSEDEMSDVYPLQLRLSVLLEKKSLGVKISKKDNTIERFRRACKIFSSESESLRIWDFSGKTTAFLFNDENGASTDSQLQAENEVRGRQSSKPIRDQIESADISCIHVIKNSNA